jgi:DNA-directed RNA polymerase subunit alpha
MQEANREFLTPNVISVDNVNLTRARVTLEPLERGFGYTLGNALRRILLSSMSGAAVTEVRIENVLHEYSSIPGVQEDVIEILLNLKNLAVRMHNRTETVLQVSKKGSGTMTAGDIQLDHDVEVVNPNHVIANLSDEGELSMQITVAKGRGYEVVDISNTPEETREVGVLKLDASYSPICRLHRIYL